MNKIKQLKQEIIEIGKLMWDKNLATGLNGNISARVETDKILLTARGTCLGKLKENELLLMNLKGEVLEPGTASSEKLLHIEIYKNFPEVTAIVHTHTSYTNGFFAVNKTLTPSTFETKFYLGEVKGIDQTTPSVTDAAPVIDGLKSNNIVVLRNHGTVAMGKSLFDCFLLIQALEEAIIVDSVSRLYQLNSVSSQGSSAKAPAQSLAQEKKYKLFSQEQVDEIVRLINGDQVLKDLGKKTQMNMDLAVKLNETGEVFSFSFQNGQIAKVGSDENAEFLISASKDIWRAVFNREIDPFVATTQKKMNLRGDFAKISRWYAPCSRIFELWQRAPVE
ncbi:MAG: class II aldolase/adducin family protein [Candidatus Omnitrophota bacterium]